MQEQNRIRARLNELAAGMEKSLSLAKRAEDKKIRSMALALYFRQRRDVQYYQEKLERA